MKVLITGGSGVVGANLAVYLSTSGMRVTVLDNLVRRGSELNLSRLKEAGVEFYHGDVRCREDLFDGHGKAHSYLKADVVLDTAAQPSAIDGYKNPQYDFTNNVSGVANVLELCRAMDAGLIFWSTNKVYPVSAVHNQRILDGGDRLMSEFAIDEQTPLDGGDRSVYGMTKIMADLMVQEHADAFQMPAVINRFSCLAGPWQWGKPEQGWVAWWVIAHRFGFPLQYIGFDGKQVRDVLYMDDLCRLIELQIQQLHNSGAEVFNVGGGKYSSMSLRECTDMCQMITGNRIPIETVPAPRRADFAVYLSDTRKVEDRYHWYPTIFADDALERIDKWVCANADTLRGQYGNPVPQFVKELEIA